MKLALNTTFLLVNEDAGPDVTPEWLAKCAGAIDAVLQGPFQDAWGGDCHCISVATPGLTRAVNVTLKASSDIQGAAGYHDDGGIYCFRDGLPALDTGDFAFSAVITHEIFETIGDPGANRWAMAKDGTLYALELCDAVEGYVFDHNGMGVAISDFLLPAFFDYNAKGPYSYLEKPTAPLTTAPDSGADYQIVMRPGKEAQVTAFGSRTVDVLRAKAKAHPSSRTSRRLSGVQ